MADVLEGPEVAELYAADPSEFVRARNALVKRLKGEGDKEGAAAVGALKKPTKVAWAINQVARRDPRGVAELRDAGGELRERQVEALTSGDAGALRDAAAARRDVVRRLASAVTSLVGDQYREEAAATFEAASIDDDLGTLLAASRMTASVPRSGDLGFLSMGDLALASPPADRPKKKTKEKGARATTRSPSPRQATGRDGPNEAPARAAASKRRPSRRAVQRHERRLADADAAVTAAERAVERAEDRLADARRAVVRAREDQEQATRERDEAAAALAALHPEA